jgi:hypothetical protein
MDEDSPEARALALVMEYGERLYAEDEWSMEDNYDTTEALYSLYLSITGQES